MEGTSLVSRPTRRAKDLAGGTEWNLPLEGRTRSASTFLNRFAEWSDLAFNPSGLFEHANLKGALHLPEEMGDETPASFADDALDLFEVDRKSTVQELVQRTAELPSLLRDLHGQVQKVFGGARIILRPDSSVDDSELVAFIATDLPVAKAHELLERLDESWWIDALPRAQGLLSIDLEFSTI